MAIKSYRNQGTKDIADGVNSKQARKTLPLVLFDNAVAKLAFLESVSSVQDLRAAPPGFGWEKLKGDRKGQHGIRINKQYRICFHFTGKDCEEVEIVDYH